jgi:hypothetical protein
MERVHGHLLHVVPLPDKGRTEDVHRLGFAELYSLVIHAGGQPFSHRERGELEEAYSPLAIRWAEYLRGRGLHATAVCKEGSMAAYRREMRDIDNNRDRQHYSAAWVNLCYGNLFEKLRMLVAIADATREPELASIVLENPVQLEAERLYCLFQLELHYGLDAETATRMALAGENCDWLFEDETKAMLLELKHAHLQQLQAQGAFQRLLDEHIGALEACKGLMPTLKEEASLLQQASHEWGADMPEWEAESTLDNMLAIEAARYMLADKHMELASTIAQGLFHHRVAAELASVLEPHINPISRQTSGLYEWNHSSYAHDALLAGAEEHAQQSGAEMNTALYHSYLAERSEALRHELTGRIPD